jgi:hypothetical protein
MEIFETMVFVALKAVPHFAINDLVRHGESSYSLFSKIHSEKEREPDELINLVEQYRKVQGRLVTSMVQKFCENLQSAKLQRNSNLSY